MHGGMELSVCRVQLLHAGRGVRTSRDPIEIPRAAPPLPRVRILLVFPFRHISAAMDLSFNFESEPYLTIYEL